MLQKFLHCKFWGQHKSKPNWFYKLNFIIVRNRRSYSYLDSYLYLALGSRLGSSVKSQQQQQSRKNNNGLGNKNRPKKSSLNCNCSCHRPLNSTRNWLSELPAKRSIKQRVSMPPNAQLSSLMINFTRLSIQTIRLSDYLNPFSWLFEHLAD